MINSVKDGGWYGTDFIEVNSANELTLSLIVKTIKDGARAPIKEIGHGILHSDGFGIDFQILVKKDFREEWTWMEYPIVVRLNFESRAKLHSDKIATAKVLSELKQKIKSFTNRIIYQNKTYSDSMKYRVDNLIVKASNIVDAIKRAKKVRDGFWQNFPAGGSTTQHGYLLKAVYRGSSGRYYGILYRPNTKDYVVACGYNKTDDTWDQGYYDFDDETYARNFAEKHARSMGDSINDSDKLKQLATQFVEAGNIFDRANSSHSRNQFEEADKNRIAGFYNLGLAVYNQLKFEVDAMKKAFSSDTDRERFSRFNMFNDIYDLLKDGASRLYWVGSDYHNQKCVVLSKKILELAGEYRDLSGKVQRSRSDSMNDSDYTVDKIPNWMKSLYEESKKISGGNDRRFEYIRSKSAVDYDTLFDWFNTLVYYDF